MKTLEQKIEVMQAALDGKEIQMCFTEGYVEAGKPIWNWQDSDYRIKPEPLEFWVNVYSVGSGFYESEESAVGNKSNDCIKTIKVREVME